jgi:hypothetical protein
VSLSAETINTNFGGTERREKNVFERLRDKMKRDIVGVDCAAHIIHNALQVAFDCEECHLLGCGAV